MCRYVTHASMSFHRDHFPVTMRVLKPLDAASSPQSYQNISPFTPAAAVF
jgi:hypothetical protein